MTAGDPYLLVRAGSIYVTVVLTLAVWVVRRPTAREVSGGVLATMWNLPALTALNLAAIHFGWWAFDARGGLFLGTPVDLLLTWAWLWGALPVLAFPRLPLAMVIASALAFDLLMMPLMSPVLQLGPAWLAGEAVALVSGLIPAQLLARWTMRGEHLAGRAVLQVITFSGLMLFLLPASVIEGSSSTWVNPFTRPTWQLSLIVQVLAIPAIAGLSAVQEFVARGDDSSAVRSSPATRHDRAVCVRP